MFKAEYMNRVVSIIGTVVLMVILLQLASSTFSKIFFISILSLKIAIDFYKIIKTKRNVTKES